MKWRNKKTFRTDWLLNLKVSSELDVASTQWGPTLRFYGPVYVTPHTRDWFLSSHMRFKSLYFVLKPGWFLSLQYVNTQPFRSDSEPLRPSGLLRFCHSQKSEKIRAGTTDTYTRRRSWAYSTRRDRVIGSNRYRVLRVSWIRTGSSGGSYVVRRETCG